MSKSLKRPSFSTSVEQSINSYDSKDNSNPYQQDSNDPNDIEACDMQHDTSTHHALEENNINTNRCIDFLSANNDVPFKNTTNTFNQNMLDIERKNLEYLQQKARKTEDDEHLLHCATMKMFRSQN